MGLEAVQAGERRAEILETVLAVQHLPGIQRCIQLPFLQDAISRELEQGKRQGSTLAVLEMDPGGKGKRKSQFFPSLLIFSKQGVCPDPVESHRA